MFMKSMVKRAVIAAAALAALTAQAQVQGPGPGAYVGGSVGGTRYDGSVPGPTLTDRSSGGIKLYGGYSFNRNFGLEAGYVNLGKFKGSLADVKADGAYLDAVGTAPLGNNFSLLGRVGAFNGRLKSTLDGSDRGTNLKVGAGLQYDLSANSAVRAEWERYRFDSLGSKSNTDFYSVGFNYRF
jgi:OOP family OmpA-OmpF porin